MKKPALTLFILFYSLILFSQANFHISPYKLNGENRFYIDRIIEVDGQTQKDLFVKSKTWIARAFNDGKEVDIFSHEDEGLIVGKGSVKLTPKGIEKLATSEEYIRYTINVYCKDGKARIVVDNIYTVIYGNPYVTSDPVAMEFKYYKKKKGQLDYSRAVTGQAKLKERYCADIMRVLDSWENELNSKAGDYSDFD